MVDRTQLAERVAAAINQAYGHYSSQFAKITRRALSVFIMQIMVGQLFRRCKRFPDIMAKSHPHPN